MTDTTVESLHDQPQGMALFRKAFRLFFLLAALHGLTAIPLWLLIQGGTLSTGNYFRPITWHAHEMVFGYTLAVIAGFLLTAASNWTGRVTAVGPLLGALGLVWFAGRVAPLLGGRVPALVIAILSLAFLPCLAQVVGRTLVQAKSSRNYKILGVLAGLFAAQFLVHLGVLRANVRWETAGYKLAIDLVLLLILIVGGRIIPLFTKNRTGAKGIRSHPRIDAVSYVFAVLLTVLDVFLAGGNLFVIVALGAAITTALRTVHWGFGAARGIPLLWVLHIGFLLIPLGFLLRAIAATSTVLNDAVALHLLTAGAIGTLTLGMMARVSLGHTGRKLVAGRPLVLAFALVILAALVRVIGPVVGGAVTQHSMHASAALWTLAFLLYLFDIGPSLFQARPDGKPG